MGPACAPPRPAPPSDRAGPGAAHWLRVAREAADDLATDCVAREQAGKAPVDEVSRLREAGLLTLRAPAGSWAGGAGWTTAYAVVREIAPTARSGNCSAVTTSWGGAPGSSPGPGPRPGWRSGPRPNSGAGAAVWRVGSRR